MHPKNGGICFPIRPDTIGITASDVRQKHLFAGGSTLMRLVDISHFTFEIPKRVFADLDHATVNKGRDNHPSFTQNHQKLMHNRDFLLHLNRKYGRIHGTYHFLATKDSPTPRRNLI
jgi:hypothetical protein